MVSSQQQLRHDTVHTALPFSVRCGPATELSEILTLRYQNICQKLSHESSTHDVKQWYLIVLYVYTCLASACSVALLLILNSGNSLFFRKRNKEEYTHTRWDAWIIITEFKYMYINFYHQTVACETPPSHLSHVLIAWIPHFVFTLHPAYKNIFSNHCLGADFVMKPNGHVKNKTHAQGGGEPLA